MEKKQQFQKSLAPALRDLVVFFSNKFGLSLDVTEDIVQKACAAAYASNRELHNPVGFIWTKANWLCLNELVRVNREEPLEFHPEPSQKTGHSEDEIEQVLEDPRLAGLSERDCELLRLLLKDYSQVEIAKLWGQRPGAVRSRLQSIRTKLRPRFKEAA